MIVGAFAVAYWALVSVESSLQGRLTFTALLAAIALIANLGSVRVVGTLRISASFAASMLAVAFLGPLPAVVVAVAAEAGSWLFERRGPRVVAVNVIGSAGPNALAAIVFEALAPTGEAAFYLELLAVSGLALATNFLIMIPWIARRDHGSVIRYMRAQRQVVPVVAISIVLTLVAAGIYRELDIGAAVFVLFTVIAFTYMAHLLAAARENARRHAALSWGVLGGLLRMLEMRDARAARHSAAVAAFARDIARACGFGDQDCEIAHTAGLLHDIGRFALSDRVLDRGRALNEEDWAAIQSHAALGAMLLSDLGVYGPIAQIVRAHHERIDGRGYPDGLTGDEMPELAKIVAVAEVYDTLTARDTYHAPMSSFQALTELRRVAGSQLDARYVEALAGLLRGKSVDYRHADAADFDHELAIERRINQVAIG